MGVSVSVERLRGWLLAGAGLLVVVVAAFLGYAHYRAHRFLTELPHRLGADIRQETNGFTYSQSDGKRTIYTIHASKAIQRKDGRYTLHDVGIVLYGRKGDRADRIYGSEFEYDQKEGVVRAMGEVHLDLKAPAAKGSGAKMDYAAGKDLQSKGQQGSAGPEEDGGRVIHVTTSGLVYLQKLGVAATDQEIEFEAGGMKGQALGADYTSDTGVLVLHSAVKMAGVERGRPAMLTASRAELDRENQKVTLSGATYVTAGKTGAEESAHAERAVLHLRRDGTVERVEGEGAVTLKGAGGGAVTAPRGVVSLNATNEPQLAVLSGGVTYGADGPLRKAQGTSAAARVVFDQKGRLEQVGMTGAVHLHERVRSSGSAGAPWSERDLTAGATELAVGVDADGKTELRDGKATGGAVLAVVSPAAKGSAAKAKPGTNGMTSSSLSAEVLTAHFVHVDGIDHLAEVHGEGHTSLRRVSSTGAVNTSSGDSLEAIFKPITKQPKTPGGHLPATQAGLGSDEIASAVENGHVVMTQLPAKKAGERGAPVEKRAVAERASYDGTLEKTTLTGNVQVNDGESELWADRIVADQKTGDAVVDGRVKVNYLQPKESSGGPSQSGGEPVHVLASRAELKHDAGTATFYGTDDLPARLWQGASQVDAPVIQFEQKEKRLMARGEGPGAPMAVRAVLTATKQGKAKAGADSKAGETKQGVFQVMSRQLVYSDQKREADFTGGVRVQSADGTMQARQAEVYLAGTHVASAERKAPDSSAGFMGGSVERMVVSGQVVIDQPGRRATGEQLVYTASNGTFALKGAPGVPPKVVDSDHGTVTGTLLEFHAGDESVVVSNGGDSGAGRVRTETRVKKQR